MLKSKAIIKSGSRKICDQSEPTISNQAQQGWQTQAWHQFSGYPERLQNMRKQSEHEAVGKLRFPVWCQTDMESNPNSATCNKSFAIFTPQSPHAKENTPRSRADSEV